MIFHPALGYFAHDYHLIQYPIEFDGKSPSTAHMKKMVDIARKEKINTVFIQSQFETSKAETIAKEIGATVIPIDNLAENWLSEMYSLAKKMKTALSVKRNEKSN
jgi:zinc transport system substrate-binding protein